jgi:hypothetical protein
MSTLITIRNFVTYLKLLYVEQFKIEIAALDILNIKVGKAAETKSPTNLNNFRLSIYEIRDILIEVKRAFTEKKKVDKKDYLHKILPLPDKFLGDRNYYDA